jgi:hypothetical protein
VHLAIGDEWDALWPSTGRWERVKVINESGGSLELQLTNAPDLPDLANTMSATAATLQDQSMFRRPVHSKSGA